MARAARLDKFYSLAPADAQRGLMQSPERDTLILSKKLCARPVWFRVRVRVRFGVRARARVRVRVRAPRLQSSS